MAKAKRIWKEISLEDLVTDYHSGDPKRQKAALELALKSMDNFIKYRVSKKYARFTDMYFDDLVQCGRLAVVKNFPNYKPSKGSLCTYFAIYIDEEIINFLSDMMWCGSRYFNNRAKAYEKAVEKLENAGVEPDMVGISDLTDFKLSTIQNMRTVIAISNPVKLGEAFSLATAEEDVSEIIAENETYEHLYDCINLLSSAERYIVLSTYGFGNYTDNETCQCNKLGITKRERERVLCHALIKIKENFLRRNMIYV